MPVGWFVAPYKRRPDPNGRIIRYVVVDDLTAQIRADGGHWTEAQVLGNQAIVKVRASAQTLQDIDDLPGVSRIPKDALDDTLDTLTNPQRQALRQIALDAGYTTNEFNTRFPGGLSTVTVGDFLRFLATRRRKPRYDQATDSIIDDGALMPVRTIESVDEEVTA